MIEIIPNWHPIIVHFSIAPLIISTVLFLFVFLPNLSSCRDELLITAKWCLYIGTFSTLLAVASGWYAYSSVAHDSEGHAAMSLHRTWAVVVLILFLIASVLYRFTQSQEVKLWFPFYLVIASSCLAVTGYLGAENVYRHGLGVMRIPERHESFGKLHKHTEPSHDVESKKHYSELNDNDHDDHKKEHNH